MRLSALIFALLMVALLAVVGAHAQVYTWVDEEGNTHYGDRPPAEHEAETLDLDTSGLSTMGGAGLRPGEEAALERLREQEAAAAERRLQRRALDLEEQRLEAEQAAAEAALEANQEPRVIYGGSVVYPNSLYTDRYRYGFNFSYHHGDKYDRWGRHRPKPKPKPEPYHGGHGYPGHRPQAVKPQPSVSPGLTRSGGRLGVNAGGWPGN